VSLADYVEAIEAALGKKAIRELLTMQPGDLPNTFADVSWIASSVGYWPQALCGNASRVSCNDIAAILADMVRSQ
jgi:hypothetical protein